MILTLVLISGCASIYPDIPLSKAEKEGRLRVGMSMAEVESIVGRRANNLEDILHVSHSSTGEKIVWVPGGSVGVFAQTYTFTFYDKSLASWSKF